MHKFKNGESPYKRAKNNLERKYRGDYKGVFRGDYDYKGVSYQSLVALEDERILVKKRVNILLVFSIILGVLVVVAVFKFNLNEGITNLLMMSPVAFYSFFKQVITKNIRHKFKTQVVEKVVKDINPNFVYLKDLHISEAEFNKTGIFSTQGRMFDGDDLISGEIEGVKFKMSDIRLKEVRKRGKSTQIVDIFKGVVFIAEFYKNFLSHTVVLGSSEAKAFGKKIKVDNIEFNKKFRVYTSDEINAFYILSPSFMQRFLRLQKRLGCSINAVFLENKIYLYIDNGKDNFELDLKSSLLQIAVVFDTYKRELENFFQIVGDLKLNNKIFKPNLGENRAENGSEIGAENG
ncbi:MAG: DUF3137 domain-containing protein [Campylobacter sp.]|nr:DUF3137 domain-containing protein [Campylobacter sp.]